MLGRPIQSLEGMAGNSHFRAASCPPARRRAGDPHGRPGLTRQPARSHTHTYTRPAPHRPHPVPLPPAGWPFKLPALDLPERPCRDTLLFSIKRDAKTAERARAAPARLLLPQAGTPGEATVILAYHSDRLSIARHRFEVLGVRRHK